MDKTEIYRQSPHLREAVQELRFRSVINRDYIINNELGKRIEETTGTMFYFKEKTREFAYLAGLDPDEMRMAFTEGIQNILEHGRSSSVEVELIASRINTEDTYLEMSFKHRMETRDFYSLHEADDSADRGILDFENPRGRGEFLMREIMDERKFINGMEKDPEGKGAFFFKRVMRKYKNPRPKPEVNQLSREFKSYIDSLQDYKSALFLRMDYFSRKVELVFSEERGSSDEIQEILQRYGYRFKGVDSYRNIAFSFWESDNLPETRQGPLDDILSEMEKLLAVRKEK